MCIFTLRQLSFTTLTHDHQGSFDIDTKSVHTDEDAELTAEICWLVSGNNNERGGGGWTRQHKDKCLFKDYSKADRQTQTET